MIHLEVPTLPPSSNHAYANVRGHGRRLTDVARDYLTGTRGYLQQHYRREMMFFQKNVPYFVLVYFYFSEVENKGYPKTCENRYKTFDGNNRLKLLEDALKSASGVDDSQTTRFFWEKKQGLPERTKLWIWNLETEVTPFDEPLRAL
jgi:hypothetical protein